MALMMMALPQKPEGQLKDDELYIADGGSTMMGTCGQRHPMETTLMLSVGLLFVGPGWKQSMAASSKSFIV